MKVVGEGMGLVEGPVYCRDGSLIVTSLDQGRVFRIDERGVKVLAETGGGANGATEGHDGLIYIAQNGGTGPALNKVRSAPGVQVIARDGSFTQFGQHMTSPNDLCFGPDGYLYVTDPTRKPERDDGRLWRCDVATGKCELLFECDWYPNGIGFDAEDRLIYIADSRHRRIVTVPIDAPDLDRLETKFVLDHGSPDGFAFDADGNLAIGCPDFGESGGDVQVYRDNKLIEIIKPGMSKHYTNVAFSSDGQIYICDADNGALLAKPWRCAELPLHPRHKKA